MTYPDGCATPVPTIDPEVLPAARPLEVADLDIPLPRTGHYEIPLGSAVLPNGVLTEADFTLVEDRQVGFLREDSLVRLVVRDPDGRILGNVYATGWRTGAVVVSVSLTFDVVAVEPGTILHLRNDPDAVVSSHGFASVVGRYGHPGQEPGPSAESGTHSPHPGQRQTEASRQPRLRERVSVTP